MTMEEAVDALISAALTAGMERGTGFWHGHQQYPEGEHPEDLLNVQRAAFLRRFKKGE